ncbi:VOC family protein [Quadrisphaera setariae]|uniref:VOC family protein n=1 Tax=Quadrisphaera setariae TaxID=2593304 RepID=A0A5C8ZH05_9ACTN|nr:VOC family protein [Quadrisphaera setariae]TXR56824.1 VOC family protein [Quadrisphaera setariae]
MHLENVVWDARDPRALGGFWAAALGARVITDEPDLLEARLALDPATGAFLDLCFPRVGHPSAAPPRLHLDLRGGTALDDLVQRLLGLGAEPADVGQGDDVPWTVLVDPEGGAFCVMPDRPGYEVTTGPVVGLPLDSADPERDAAFWAAVSGWRRTDDVAGAPALQHPGGIGPLLALCPEPRPKPAGRGGKNRVHLDVRRDASDLQEQDDDGERAVVERLLALGATSLSAPGELPWLVFADPSGNELCVLPPSPST